MRQKKGFPIWGKLSAKRTDEGKAYVAVIKTGNKANFPLIRRCGATFSLRAKSRLRRLRSDTRLWAQPRVGTLYFFKNSSIIFSPTAPDFSGWNWQPRTLPWLAAAQISRPP